MIENAFAALLDAQLAPVRAEVSRLADELAALRRALPPQLVTLSEAARALGVSYATIRRRAKDGTLPLKRFGRTVRVDLAALTPPDDAHVIELAEAIRTHTRR